MFPKYCLVICLLTGKWEQGKLLRQTWAESPGFSWARYWITFSASRVSSKSRFWRRAGTGLAFSLKKFEDPIYDSIRKVNSYKNLKKGCNWFFLNKRNLPGFQPNVATRLHAGTQFTLKEQIHVVSSISKIKSWCNYCWSSLSKNFWFHYLKEVK